MGDLCRDTCGGEENLRCAEREMAKSGNRQMVRGRHSISPRSHRIFCSEYSVPTHAQSVVTAHWKERAKPATCICVIRMSNEV